VSALVINASIAIKWVIEEEGTKEALALRNQALAAPDLLIAECANILWKKARRRKLSARKRSSPPVFWRAPTSTS
jgi:predicted nucleic acid-binding protein